MERDIEAEDGQGSVPLDRDVPKAPCLRRATAIVLSAYVATRLLLGLAAILGVDSSGVDMANLLSRWDGQHFLEIAAHGYPRHVDVHSYALPAFFPGYPLLVRAFVEITSVSYVTAGVTVSLIAGAFMLVACTHLAVGLWGQRVGTRAALFVAVFPGSMFAGLPYAESTALAFAALSLLELQNKKPLRAAILGAFATLCSPVTLPLVGAFAWTAWKVRSRSAVVATAIAPVGALAYQLFLWIHTGSPFTWVAIQRYGWGHHFDPLSPLHHMHDWPAAKIVLTLTLLFVAVALVGARRVQLPPTHLIYGIAVVFCITFDAASWTQPRALFNAFPLVLAFGAWVARRKWFYLVLGGFTAMTPLVFLAYMALDQATGPP